MNLLVWARKHAKYAVRANLLRGKFSRKVFEYLPSSGSETAILMCLWNRPSRIDDVLAMLDQQDCSTGVRLYLWNNNRADHGYYLAKLLEFIAVGALKGVEIAKSPYNLGSIGRFYWAREIAKRTPGVPIIVVDDDQNFRSTLVSEALATFRPKVVAGWWAWTVEGNYWSRKPAGLGNRVDHIGPGGSVLSSDIFAEDAFFTDIPDQYGLLDDIWLSYFVKSRGYSLAKLPVDIEFVMDNTNQHHTQGYVKPEFFNYLYPE